jgi:hypothetical protein
MSLALPGFEECAAKGADIVLTPDDVAADVVRHFRPQVRRDVGLVMGRQTTLDDCPPGLFVFDGGYGFKTEYNDANGPEAYCLDSGEYFWGGTNGDVHARRMLLVTPFHLEPNVC